MAASQKQGKHKNYGPKMANPRIKSSKEHRGRGPLGLFVSLSRLKTPPEWRSREYVFRSRMKIS
jgi:hypothetical protein